MRIVQFESHFLASNQYLIIENKCAIVVDPFYSEKVFQYIEKQKLQIDFLFVTHEHYDHISGVNAFKERYHCPLLCGCVCGERISNSKTNFSHYFSAFYSLGVGAQPKNMLIEEDYTCNADYVFVGEYNISWQNHCLHLQETPGHSPGSVCLEIDGRVLFSGDTLLPIGTSIMRLPGGSKTLFEEKTIPFLKALSSNIMVYPGHYNIFALDTHEMFREIKQI